MPERIDLYRRRMLKVALGSFLLSGFSGCGKNSGQQQLTIDQAVKKEFSMRNPILCAGSCILSNQSYTEGGRASFIKGGSTGGRLSTAKHVVDQIGQSPTYLFIPRVHTNLTNYPLIWKKVPGTDVATQKINVDGSWSPYTDAIMIAELPPELIQLTTGKIEPLVPDWIDIRSGLSVFTPNNGDIATLTINLQNQQTLPGLISCSINNPRDTYIFGGGSGGGIFVGEDDPSNTNLPKELGVLQGGHINDQDRVLEIIYFMPYPKNFT